MLVPVPEAPSRHWCKQACTLRVLLFLLLLLPLASMDDHPPTKALQEAWRLLALLDLDL